MAEEEQKEGAPEEAPPTEAAAALEQKSASSKKMMIIGVAVLVALLAGAAVYYFLVMKKPPEAEHGATPAKTEGHDKGKEEHKPIFYDLPEVFVNLNMPGSTRMSFLKLTLSLELEDEPSTKLLEEMKPRIIDQLQVYLRQLKVDDLKGSAGLQKLRTELQLRIRAVTAPAKIKGVLFKEMLFQ